MDINNSELFSWMNADSNFDIDEFDLDGYCEDEFLHNRNIHEECQNINKVSCHQMDMETVEDEGNQINF